MEFNYFGITFVFALSLFLTTSAQSCDPALDCSIYGTPGGTVPHPTNCERFYYCLVNGDGGIIPSATSVACPDGTYYQAAPYFNAGCIPETKVGICDDNYCGKAVDPSNLSCPSACTSTVPSFIADTENCSTYYVCLAGGSTLLQYCPPEAPYFDGVSCVTDQSQCCDFSTPYCTVGGTQIADPQDCTSFYICGKAGEVPSESYRYSCPSDQHFNASSSACVDGSCSNGQSTNSPDVTTTSGFTIEPTTTTPTPPECTPIENFRCPADGYYAQCTTCKKTYFHCVGGVAELGYCPSTTVFNPVASYPACIQQSSCPYYP